MTDPQSEPSEQATNMIDLDAIEARIRDCKTYNFGLWNADKLAHEDAPAMLNELRHLRVIASGNQGAIVNSIIERTRTSAPRMIDTYGDQVSEVSFDQGWAVTVHRHGYGCTLEWERRGSLDEHLTDILPSEALVFAAAIAGEFANTSGEVPEPSAAAVTLSEVHKFAIRERDSIRGRYGAGSATYAGYANACEDILGIIGGMSPHPGIAEPQGEPSDAQRNAAMDEAWAWRAETRSISEKWAAQHWFNSGWRAALRAAGGVR